MAKIQIKYSDSLAQLFRRSSDRLLETRSLLESIAKRLRYTFQKNITESASPEGNAYAPLVKPIRKKVRKTETRPLIDSGNLVNSFDYVFLGEKTVVVGDPTHYGIYHQTGTKHVPKRSFIGIRPTDQQDLDYIVGNWAGWVFGIYDAPEANVFLETKAI